MLRRSISSRLSMAKYFKVTLDWDGTLTTQDTMFMMSRIAAQRDKRLSRNSDDSKETWTKFGKAYLDDMAIHKKKYVPQKELRINPESECIWMQSCRNVETASVTRVEKSGFFKGVTRADVVEAVAEASDDGSLALRKDWHRMFVEAAAARAGVPLPPNAHVYELEILSVNWSELMIRETLLLNVDRLTTIDDIQRKNMRSLVEHMSIQANEIAGLDLATGSTGSLTRPERLGIRTNLDKLKCYVRNWDQIHVYIGDSGYDLDCLLVADVGILMRDEPMRSSQQELAEALERTHVFVKHVFEHTQITEGEAGLPPEARFWWAKDFFEISSFLARITVHRG